MNQNIIRTLPHAEGQYNLASLRLISDIQTWRWKRMSVNSDRPRWTHNFNRFVSSNFWLRDGPMSKSPTKTATAAAEFADNQTDPLSIACSVENGMMQARRYSRGHGAITASNLLDCAKSCARDAEDGNDLTIRFYIAKQAELLRLADRWVPGSPSPAYRVGRRASVLLEVLAERTDSRAKNARKAINRGALTAFDDTGRYSDACGSLSALERELGLKNPYEGREETKGLTQITEKE